LLEHLGRSRLRTFVGDRRAALIIRWAAHQAVDQRASLLCDALRVRPVDVADIFEHFAE
jgi:hypothetical protein